MSWVSTLHCTRTEADAAAMLEDPFPAVDPAPVLVALEVDDGWALKLYTPEPPDDTLLQGFSALAPSASRPAMVELLADDDWVTLSQAGLEPVTIGRFHIHTREHAGEARPGQWPLRIDAGLAFGTGQHATTAGCLHAVLDLTRQQRRFTNILDVGTGAGLLAFAAARLHRRARITASDLDPVAVAVAADNLRLNHLLPGRTGGRTLMLAAPGVEHRQIAARAPYDLVFANILAGPLTALAPSLSAVVAKGGYLVLAGLLQPQVPKLLNAYGKRGLRLVWRSPRAEWPVLVMRKVTPSSRRAAISGSRREVANRGWKIDTL